MTFKQRASGILLHPTSLPGPHGIGDLGNEAWRFVDFLAGAGQNIWQILPLGPAGYGHSPYSALSAFAGNPLLISLERLIEEGDLEPEDLTGVGLDEGTVHFGFVAPFKKRLLHKGAKRFREGATERRKTDFDDFCRVQAAWLEDFVLFCALRSKFNDMPWQQWPPPLRSRQPDALQQVRQELADALHVHRYEQFVFFEQWLALRNYANRRGVRILGDLPIFVALDSADVWAHPGLFHLDAQLQPTVIAGVPPDYFSATGQRWGNPLYRWETHQNDDFTWWQSRLNWNLQQCDLLRIDHFRGFVSCWAIPAGDKTAVNGQWWETPGEALFSALRHSHPHLPLVAEDLGVITPEVEHLRDRLDLPGMKILQFAFDSGPDNPYLPHNLPKHCVIYTGTHDNDTSLGWWQTANTEIRNETAAYLGHPITDMPWDLIHLAWASVAQLAICPLQDVLSLGGEARMNYPGRADANWSWRYLPGALTSELQQRLADLTRRFGRAPKRSG
ncbi:4-alpha-glucanotransferase [Syntrophotalea carbinolica DSM 2380]|uniref:4-alpha-glucanotransferase n=1 Tax=Syntrophotalea carbinolica (strain DSM 2380 / NBRC 103641 / GraBd1) TaxID=338963 RepID=Q3A733_SYNC1|nr:4-alpha-glucanotransferase [Syntrophotalea carbinolica]ABA87814.1 4-alpha-glucanotransferase [Syntrophotalea carbinolica DSM 2380]